MTTPAKTEYDKNLHRVYQQSRQLPDDTNRLWMDHLSRYVSREAPFQLLDLGSGTGRFSKLIADRFDCHVVGVEPSDKMREIAERSSDDSRVRFLPGNAGHIPATDGTFVYAWLSMVVHHVQNVEECAEELARVLTKDGLVFIRNAFNNRLEDICMYKYFPRAFEIDKHRLPNASYLIDAFSKHGFSFVAHDVLNQTIDRCFNDHIERLRQRGISTLALLTEEEFAQGIANMEQASKQMDPAKPVVEKIDFLVLRKKENKKR
jgi:ubiquinone/menaquinone biosynthesis C-methylase UbiE